MDNDIGIKGIRFWEDISFLKAKIYKLNQVNEFGWIYNSIDRSVEK